MSENLYLFPCSSWGEDSRALVSEPCRAVSAVPSSWGEDFPCSSTGLLEPPGGWRNVLMQHAPFPKIGGTAEGCNPCICNTGKSVLCTVHCAPTISETGQLKHAGQVAAVLVQEKRNVHRPISLFMTFLTHSPSWFFFWILWRMGLLQLEGAVGSNALSGFSKVWHLELAVHCRLQEQIRLCWCCQHWLVEVLCKRKPQLWSCSTTFQWRDEESVLYNTACFLYCQSVTALKKVCEVGAAALHIHGP